MKKLTILAIAALAFAFAPTASAQYTRQAVITTTLNGGTNVVAAATTNSPNLVLQVPDSEYIGLHFGFASDATNDTTIRIVLKESLDGTTYATGESHTLSVAANGTTAVNVVTNINVGAIRYLKLTSIENANGASALTNVVFSYGFKR